MQDRSGEDLATWGISADLAVNYACTGWLTVFILGPNEPLALNPALLCLERRFEGLHVGG